MQETEKESETSLAMQELLEADKEKVLERAVVIRTDIAPRLVLDKLVQVLCALSLRWARRQGLCCRTAFV